HHQFFVKTLIRYVAAAVMGVLLPLAAQAQVPAITSVNPAFGPMGSSVTLQGSNFSPIPNNDLVYFGAVRAVGTAPSATSLTVTVPTGATCVPITVTVGGLTGSARAPF